jgi:methyltransferase (TIGR00027 family)
MDHGHPSQTAMTAAAARAAHLVVDADPPIFADTLAYRLLGDQAEELVGYHRLHGTHVVLRGARVTVTTRSRFTEDRLAAAVHRGVTQYVVLGAGLDTFAYRSDLADRVRVFEVDQPATQRWKRKLLAEAGVAEPPAVAYVPVDFERDRLTDRLVDRGFDPSRPAFVSWLGVTMYLTREAVDATLDALGHLAPDTELVVEYMLPGDLRDADGQQYAEAVASFTAEQGEPWTTFLRPEEVSALLARHGFGRAGHVGQRDMVDPALWERSDSLRPAALTQLAHATIPPSLRE